MLGKIIALSSMMAMAYLVFLLQTTTPSTIGPLGILLVFILMYITALGVLTFFIVGLQKLLLKITVAIDARKAFAPMSFMRAYYFASVMALGPVMIIGMQSVNLLRKLALDLRCRYILLIW